MNPYLPGQPVDNPRLFVGRHEVLTSIQENLIKGQRFFLVASPPRLGKSSLLRQIPFHLPEGFVAVRVDLLEENAQKLDWLLWRLAVVIDHELQRQIGSAGLSPVWSDFEGRTEYLVDQFGPEVRAALGDRGLMLLLDDLDALAQSGSALWTGLLGVLAAWCEQDRDLALVVTMSAALYERLTRDHPTLLGRAVSYSLPPLSSEEASLLVTRPVEGILTYDYGVVRRLVELTSGQPYYLQFLCFELFQRCAATGWVNQHDVDLVIQELVSREIPDFRRVWEESSPSEQATLAALVSLRGARGVATVQEVRTLLAKAGMRVDWNQVTTVLEGLAARGVVDRLGVFTYRFRVALLRDWLKERIDLSQVIRRTRWEPASSDRASGAAPVVKLTAKRGRRGKPPPVPSSATGEMESKPEAVPASGRQWTWMMAVGAVILALGALAAFWVLRSLPGGTGPVVPSSVAATRTASVSSAPTSPEATSDRAVTPTLLPTPLPSPTQRPTPTPPVIIARSVPALAYQSRERGDRSWFVYVMDSDGSNRTRLVEGQSGFLSAPSWSPDGTRLVLASDREGRSDLWVMDRDGSHLINLTQDEARDHCPAWSPDGQWIAFGSLRDSLYWELYLIRADGSDVQRLTWWEDASDLWPSWSPDGTRLAFASKRDGNWEIYVVNFDGSGLVRLTDHPADDTNPAWSPDGSRIAFESTRAGYAELYVMPVLGGEAVNLSNAPFSSEHGPTWSPDGGRIAFYSDRDGDWDIYVMAADGSDVVKLTGDLSDDQVPAWRP